MLTLDTRKLSFSFPEVHPDAKCSISFIRTLRIPDNGTTYPLPPGLGTFPVKHVDDYRSRVPAKWVERQGVMIPMHQSEALWIKFESNFSHNHRAHYPFAVKVAAGKRNAITGDSWWPKLRNAETGHRQDYCVIPQQPWLDGFAVEKGKVRQFVAAPLGQGLTVEAQLDGQEVHGGLQIQVYPLKSSVFAAKYPVRVTKTLGRETFSEYGMKSGPTLSVMRCCLSAPSASSDMGLGAGGLMTQDISVDDFSLADWDQEHTSRAFVHLMNSENWQSVTGEIPPPSPATEAIYRRYQYPWFQYYSDSPSLEASPLLAGIKSVDQIKAENFYPSTVIPLGSVKPGIW